MSKKYFVIFGLFLAVSVFVSSAGIVGAYTTTAVWTGGGDGVTWTDPGNWGNTSSNAYPGASTTDAVLISTQTPTGDIIVRATSTLPGSLSTLTLGAANTGGPTLILGNGATISASTSVILVSTSTLKLGDSTWGSGNLTFANGNDSAIPFRFGTTTTAFSAATGTVTFTGTGSNIVIATTTYYNLNLTPTSTATTVTYKFGADGFSCTSGGCTATTTVSNVLTVSPGARANFNSTTLILSGSGTVFSKANGIFVANGSVIQYTSASATNIATGTYDNLNISGAATKTLLGNTTATSTITVASGSTLAISTYTFTATGSTWTNSGTVTEGTGGKITLASASQFDDGAGTAKSSFSGDGRDSVYVRVTDTSLNLLAATAETQTVTITARSMITDTETVTLIETGVATGIFSGGVTFGMSGTNVGGQLDYQGGGTLSFAYTDSQDSSDTGSGTGNFTGTAPGGGGSSSSAATTVTTTTVTPTVATETTTAAPATTATPVTTVSGLTLDSIQTKIASAVAKMATLSANPSASDLADVQAQIAAILADIQAIQTTTAPQGTALGYNFVRSLALGMSSADVTNLQQALKTDSSIYPEGKVTGYFGALTLKAVKAFQEKYGIASEGQAGYGYVGPKTRAKLNELYGAK